MKSLARTLFWLLGLLFLAVATVSIGILFFFDPNDYKADIEAVVEEQTGRDITIEGDLGLSVFPCCAVELGRTTLSNPADFGGGNFLIFDSAAVSIRVLPLLLEQSVEVGAIRLSGVELLLQTTRNGEVNWAFDATDDSAGASDTPADGAGGVNGLSVAGIEFTDGTVRWLDDQSDTDISLTGLNVVTGPIELGEPFDIEAGFLIAGLAEGVDGEFKLAARPQINADGSGANLDNSSIKLALTGDTLPGGRAELSFDIGKAQAGGGRETLNADEVALTLSSGDLELTLTASGSVTDAGPDFSGTLTSNEFSPRTVLAAAGSDVVTPDAEALSKASLTGNWLLRQDRFALTELNAVLDDTQLNGWLRLDSIANAAIRTEMQVDAINLDRYIASDDDTDGGGGASSDSAAEPLPVEALRGLDLQAKFGVGAMIFSEALLQSVQMTVVAKDGRLRMNPLTAQLYDGLINGDIQVDVRGSTPKLAVNQSLTGVQIGAFLADTSDISNVTGLFETRLNATATGDTLEELIAGLDGDLRFDLQDAVYLGRDFWYELRAQKAKLSGKPLPLAPEDPKTEITEALGSGVIENGVLTNRDFNMQIPFLRISGAGQADLNSSQLDYQLNAKVIGTPEFDDGENLDELNGLTLPVSVTGDFDDPEIRFDLTSVIAGLAAKKLQERLLKKYGGVEEPAAGAAEGEGVDAGDTAPEAEVDAVEQDNKSDRDATKELLRESIRDLF